MKVLFSLALTSALAAALATSPVQAQVNINIVQPAWGPAVPAGAQYYYVPEYDGYYDLAAQRYIVLRNGQWRRVAALSGYNPAGFHPVVIDYRGATPWVLVREHRLKFKAKGHPHGMPPGQAKKLRGAHYVAPSPAVIVVDERDHGKHGKHGRGHGKH